MTSKEERARLERLYARYDVRQASLDLGDATWQIDPDMRNWYYDGDGVKRYKSNDRAVGENF